MAINYYREGYNCAESIIQSVNEKKKINIPVCIGSPFGSGMSTGSVCGAATAAVVAIGYLKGRNHSTEQNKAARYSKDLIKKIREKFGSEICIDLKRKGVSCKEIIQFVDDYLKTLTQE
ncbi:oxidoreductase [Crassaminicella thermophila]|uniref:Oxidoreductase n=1 Tax=Crassaminicella thermophila TaxID=2599308 RepID=A0A5C0SC78_CRATE|nr:C-GCAxxG-C-C family (seleno)protein [Crassaminicella thermophila]QEK11532.1 oxidoreductase [Crassaminicella thermophila]